MDLGVALEGLKPEEIEAALWRQLEARGTACLWIVDDVPSGITTSRHLSSISWTNEEGVDLASWIARHDYERGEYAGARKLEE